MHIMVEEDKHGTRHTNLAVRVWPETTGRPVEQLGWPQPEVAYQSGTRVPAHASFDLRTGDGRSLMLDVEPILGIPLAVGTGYGIDPDWQHGVWKGEEWVDGGVYDHNDPAVAGRAAFSITDYIARVNFDGQDGWGIFEHASIGPHAPSGFTDYTDGAP